MSRLLVLLVALLGLHTALAASADLRSGQSARGAKIAGARYYSQQFQPRSAVGSVAGTEPFPATSRRQQTARTASSVAGTEPFPATSRQQQTARTASSVAGTEPFPATSRQQQTARTASSGHTDITARLFGLLQNSNGLQVSWSSLITLGVLVLGAIIILPWITTKLDHHSSSSYGSSYNSGYGRAEDGAAATIPSLMSLLDSSLRKYDIDSTACVQRGVCAYVRSAALSVLEGRAGSSDLILDGLASNSYVATWLDGTAVLEASNAGRSGVDCDQAYPKCSLSADAVYRAIGDAGGDI